MAVDLISPWKVQVRGKPHESNAFTCIDRVTNLVQIVRIYHKTLQHVTGKLHKVEWQDTPGQKDMSIITVDNSQDGNSKSFFKSAM